ncbi:hypothetical protein PY650_21585 [Rhizobium calliandrae]|uniref:Uncharacterized protein n=1 Tax=Rhizobium calliandrae TaxID=1312182 RepID=A0ABT7KHS9_9HYPH|nr:hypothetical protein [Rhizobium calliandrae]MDL2408192.1 hypothetical protein [Rhizobium calliandrae]
MPSIEPRRIRWALTHGEEGGRELRHDLRIGVDIDELVAHDGKTMQPVWLPLIAGSSGSGSSCRPTRNVAACPDPIVTAMTDAVISALKEDPINYLPVANP